MSDIAEFGMGGTRIVTSLENTPNVATAMSASAASANAITALSGAMTLNVLKTALTKTGRGRLNWFGVYCNDATSRTIRVQITLDGVVIKNSTTGAIAASISGVCVVGMGGVNGAMQAFQPLDYNTSLLVEYASSITETDKLTVAYNHEVHQ